MSESSSNNSNLPSYTSDSRCSHYGANSLTLRVGLTHEQCLLFEPADITLQGVTCLVGTNGSGKTSLARVLPQLPGFPDDWKVEYVSAEEGAVNASTLTPVQYLHQVVQDKLQGLRNQMEELENRDDSTDDQDAIEQMANQLAELYEREEELMESSEQEIQQALDALGFVECHHNEKTLAQLSSGWRYKCRLVASFLLHAELLIIDEPSFLDGTSMQWLVQKIQQQATSSILLLISHKEQLLETLADRILYLNSENKTLTTYNCGYTEFRSVLETQRTHAHKSTTHAHKQQQNAHDTLHDLQKQLRRREGNLKATTSQNADQRFIKGKNKEAKQKADRSAAAKVKQLQKQTAAMQQLAQQAQKERIKPLDIPGCVYSGMHLATLEQVGFAYDNDNTTLLFADIDAQLGPTDHILLRGSNGSGKSTLVRLLLGQLEPTQGKITHHTSSALYFPQTAMSDLMQHHGQQRAVDYLQACSESDATETAIRQHLGDFGLVRTVALRPIASLSAGQRVRLWLAAQVWKHPEQQPSLLVLDEISENVDIETRQSLVELLHLFVGAVLVISHDPDFCESFEPTQIWTLALGGLQINFGDENTQKMSGRRSLGKGDIVLDS